MFRSFFPSPVNFFVSAIAWAAVAMTIWFTAACWRVWSRDELAAIADNYAVEKRAFRISLSYLFLVFGALLAEKALAVWGLGGWGGGWAFGIGG